MEYLYIVLIIILLIALIVLAISLSNVKKESRANLQKIDSLKASNSSLISENQGLSKYKACQNADEYARKVRFDADEEAKLINFKAREKADSIVSAARSDANNIEADINSKLSAVGQEIAEKRRNAHLEMSEIVEKAKGKAEELMSDAKSMQLNASKHANEIIQAAKEEAKTIAGDAYKISENVEKYRKEATALRNIIEGYGDKYIKPSESVLDDLAEEFGFTEAGKELARTRELCKNMIESGYAATSEYVEPYRKKTAIEFILDAFNGKVDSILSTVKSTNVGILERKIDDAYTIVNRLGSAFRDTRITPEYLRERQNELRWAVAVVVLKTKQKEEQRAIKERIREEERARREYEKAMKDAKRQEALIRAAIEKANLQLAKANEEQRRQYEQKLSELQLQLEEAEARNQRALSMAQQTRSGHVYIISNIGSFGENVYKIGMTRRLEPLDRVRELGDASVPFPFDVHAMIYSEDAPALETELHKVFARCQVNKVNPKKEFFRLPLSTVKNHIDSKGLDVQWTLLAEASQYKESKALEESFKNDSNLENEWESRQKSSMDQQEYEDISIEEN